MLPSLLSSPCSVRRHHDIAQKRWVVIDCTDQPTHELRRSFDPRYDQTIARIILGVEIPRELVINECAECQSRNPMREKAAPIREYSGWQLSGAQSTSPEFRRRSIDDCDQARRASVANQREPILFDVRQVYRSANRFEVDDRK